VSASINGSLPARFLYLTRVEHHHEVIYTENLREYFNSVGVPTREIVMSTDGAQRSELAQCLNGDAIAVLGFNWHLDHSAIGSRHFLDLARKANVSVVQWLIDHPSTRWPDFKRTNAANSRFLFLSPYAEAYFRRFVMPRCRSASVTGNTGTSRYSRNDEMSRESFRARDIRCLLPLNLTRVGGTIHDAETAGAALPPSLGAAVARAIERAQNDLEHPIERFFYDDNPPRDLLKRPELLHCCIQIIEETVQIRRRLAVFSTARSFPVLIQSDDAWANEGQGRARFEQGVSMRETLSRMQRARAVVSLTHVNDEMHNRVLNALNAGAIPIIEDTAVHRRFFEHGKNALLFRHDDDSFRECIDLVCNDPDRAYEIAAAGRALRDDPRLRFGGYDQVVALAEPIPLSDRVRYRVGW
jgi:Glycosyl transferases group 1